MFHATDRHGQCHQFPSGGKDPCFEQNVSPNKNKCCVSEAPVSDPIRTPCHVKKGFWVENPGKEGDADINFEVHCF